MRSILYLLAGAFLLQCVVSCPRERVYSQVIPKSNNSLISRGFPIEKKPLDLWPNGRITYCFNPENNGLARTRLKSIIPAAWKIWLDAGANRGLTMKEGDSTYCNVANRGAYLEISYNNQGILETTPGMIFGGGGGSSGPSMTLDPSDGIGCGSGVSNIAHEIGHSWGLIHEHQRPSLWTQEYGGNAQINTFQFTCENLADYDAVLAQFGNMNRPCHYERAAAVLQFSARNLLPQTRLGVDRGQAGVVDWKSIMIYGSTAGGKTVNGQRLNTLTKADGSTFGYNLFPSEKDIITLNNLYSDEITEKPKRARLAFENPSSWKGIFDRLNRGSSCM